MTSDLAMHALGCASLTTMAGLSASILADAIWPSRHRILAALRGEPVSPPAALVDPAPPPTLVPTLAAYRAGGERNPRSIGASL